MASGRLDGVAKRYASILALDMLRDAQVLIVLVNGKTRLPVEATVDRRIGDVESRVVIGWEPAQPMVLPR